MPLNEVITCILSETWPILALGILCKSWMNRTHPNELRDRPSHGKFDPSNDPLIEDVKVKLRPPFVGIRAYR
ncbi:MAG: hypothetical protein DCF12_14270 [Snowella sp.]|nr:MAG: hypothetical protein DCF12_14270 [Snowella sp.]